MNQNHAFSQTLTHSHLKWIWALWDWWSSLPFYSLINTYYSLKILAFWFALWLTVLLRIKSTSRASWGLRSTQIASRLQFHIMSCEANVHLPPRPSQQSLMSHTVLKCLTRVWLFKFSFIVKENSFSPVPLSDLAMIISYRIRVCGCMLATWGWEAAFSINPQDKILPSNDNAKASITKALSPSAIISLHFTLNLSLWFKRQCVLFLTPFYWSPFEWMNISEWI